MYTRTCVLTKDSDQSANSRSRIRIFTERALVANDVKFFHADNDDSIQTARMRSLIWVFVGRTYQKVSFLHVAAPKITFLHSDIQINSVLHPRWLYQVYNDMIWWTQ